MPVTTFGGLASGLDTNAIIDGLVRVESTRLNSLNDTKLSIKSKLSAIGSISSKLSALATSATSLSDNGVRAVKIGSSNADFSATAQTGAVAGRYAVSVQQTATAAKARSNAFVSEYNEVTEGTISIGVDGTNYDITVGPATTLKTVMESINASDAPVSAALLDDGTNKYLSITRLSTGHQIGQPAASALSITETYTGTNGAALGATITTTAQNAKFTVDGLAMERTTNTVTGAVPGATLNLTGQTNTVEDLVLNNDSSGTKSNLQGFVDNFNTVLGLIDSKVTAKKGENIQYSLAGDSALRGLRQSLNGVITGTVASLTAVRSLVDLGITSQKGGQLTLDAAMLDKAVAKDPDAVNRLFSDTVDGIGKVLTNLDTAYTDANTGILTSRKKGMNTRLVSLDESITSFQKHIDSFKQQLTAQFAAMESVVSGLNGVSSFLAQSSGNGWNLNGN